MPARRAIGPPVAGSGGEVLRADALDEVVELLDQLLGVLGVVGLLVSSSRSPSASSRASSAKIGVPSAGGQGDGVGRAAGDDVDLAAQVRCSSA